MVVIAVGTSPGLCRLSALLPYVRTAQFLQDGGKRKDHKSQEYLVRKSIYEGIATRKRADQA